ncbi:MAG TPA: pyridoxal-phosphate dependent enzyme [Nitrososphaerales archaeon]|nr:pyridoxal-phosphate dependent enzyme [Nitrososphaerales archaeon]
MQSIVQDTVASAAREDHALVKSFLQKLGAPYYDTESGRHVNSTPILDITDEVARFVGGSKPNGNRFYLKLEYKNQLTESVKGRAVASMVLNAIRDGAIYNKSGTKKRWIEPTSGNTGKGLAEIADLLGVEFTAVFSRLDVSEEIKEHLTKFRAKILTIGSEYRLDDLEALAQKHHKTVVYYWSNFGGANDDIQLLFSGKVAAERKQRSLNAILGQIDGNFLLDGLLPLSLEASETPMISRVQKGEFDKLKNDLLIRIPELGNPNKIVAFVCAIGNTSMLLSTLLNQLGFTNVCSIQGGVKALRSAEANEARSSEFCPLPGASIAKSSIEFVKKLVGDNPEEYFTFMQYENVENVYAHASTTGPELLEQTRNLDYVVCTFGSGGTATGLAQYFADKKSRVIVAFPDRPVEGIRTLSGADGLAFYKPELYEQVIKTSTAGLEAVLEYFAKRGLGFGPSTAIALLAAIEESREQKSKTYAVIAADGIENYASEYGHILGPR